MGPMRTSPLLALFVSLGSTLAGSTPTLLETGAAAKHAALPARDAAIRVVSYNVRYPGAEGIARIADALRTDREIGGASVVALLTGPDRWHDPVVDPDPND